MFDAQTNSLPAVAEIATIDELSSIVASIDANQIALRKLLKRAAVSAIFREHTERGLELFFIQRANHPDDPWSGHMAFPGGRVERTDDGTQAAAERETVEEVGIDLPDNGEWLGRLSDVMATSRGKLLPLSITAHVYHLQQTPSLELNYEVADAVWVPLRFLLDSSNRNTMEYSVAGYKTELPCYRFRGKLIWGLTLRMLDELLEACWAQAK
jgi:8-oxo-dGTP pyrophosphatase MutT (NUDIX family)